MSDQRMDRRVRRTKRRLKEALFELLDEKAYDQITIREITERADAGRSTFYSHYDSKEELLFSGFDDWLLSLAAAADTAGGAKPEDGPRFRFSLPLLKHVSFHQRFFDAVMVRGASSRVRRRIIELLAEVARRELEREAPSGAVSTARGTDRRPGRDRSRDALAHTVAGAFLGMVGWWLQDGKGASPEEVDRLFQSTVNGALVGPE